VTSCRRIELKDGVDFLVRLDHLAGSIDIHAGQRVERPLEHRGDQAPAMMQVGQSGDALAAGAMQLARLVGDFGRLVTTTFEVGHDSRDGHHQPQIASGGLPACDQQRAVLVDVDFKSIHLAIGADDPPASPRYSRY
jgi:hypothetical protein